MSIDRIRYFSVVAETGHIRKAAELLGLNPGSLSKAIKALEDDLGCKLLRQSGRGIVITDAGKEFHRRSGRVLTDYEELIQAARSPNLSHAQPAVRIGSFEIFTSYFLTRMTEIEFPEERVLAKELIPGDIESSLIRKEIDLGITYIPYPRPEVEHVRVGSFLSKIFIPRKLAQTPFDQLPFAIPITTVSTSASNLRSLDGWPVSIHRRVKYEFQLLETAIQAARAGRAALYCPSFLIDLHNQTMPDSLKLHEYPSPPKGLPLSKTPIYLVHRKDEPETQHFRKVARFIRGL